MDLSKAVEEALQHLHDLKSLQTKKLMLNRLGTALEKEDPIAGASLLGEVTVGCDLVLPMCRELFFKYKKELLAAGVETPDLPTDGLKYCGYRVEDHEQGSISFPVYPVLEQALHRLNVKKGAWFLDDKGVIHLRHCGPEQSPLLPITSYSVYEDLGKREGIELDPIPNDRVKQSTVAGLSYIVHAEGKEWIALPKELKNPHGLEFNSAEVLPPVPCPILILVPIGTNYTDKDGAEHVTSHNSLLRASRTAHLSSREGIINYYAEDFGTFSGRFRWTYP